MRNIVGNCGIINELGYQKKLAASMEGIASFVDVKRPPVVCAAYELIMMLGM